MARASPGIRHRVRVQGEGTGRGTQAALTCALMSWGCSRGEGRQNQESDQQRGSPAVPTLLPKEPSGAAEPCQEHPALTLTLYPAGEQDSTTSAATPTKQTQKFPFPCSPLPNSNSNPLPCPDSHQLDRTKDPLEIPWQTRNKRGPGMS